MNNKHIQELTFRLSHALDQNYDVVNLDTVLSVISALEGATITKEQLEATRLAKYINQLRRRTKSEQLARRAKSLLKKWREMVGIQSQTTEALSDHNTVIVSMREEYLQRSQPTSPIATSNNVELIDEKVVSKTSMEQFLRSSPYNSDVVTLTSTGSADLKKKSVVGTSTLSNVPTPCVPKTGNSQSRARVIKSDISNQQQPTSFANLLTGISSSPLSSENTGDILSTSSSRKSNKRKDRTHDRSMGRSIVTKTIVVDQSSSSNADFSRTTTMKNELPVLNMLPVVIDIQDSNSSSNPAHIQPSVGSNSGMCSSKAKKIKKDRKHKDREHPHNASILSCPIAGYVSNVIDESSSSQRAKIEYDKFDDRSRVKYPLSGMSEILSLSNSSMSSVFPNSTVVGSSVTTSTFAANKQRRTETSARSNSSKFQTNSLSTCDLTFTGKFKQHSLALSSDLFGFSPPLDTVASTKDLSSTNTFLPFSSSGCNSIDSTSNSRISQFDIIDVVNQDKSQTKIIDELRQSKKKYSGSSTNLSVQKNQQKSNMITDSAAQILMPPTSARQLNTSIDGAHVYNESKIPKKRGRKKGSKGVDSVIAKETSLSSQMLMSTLGCKKVKTTKELYAEMQNRKLGVSLSTTSPTLSNWLVHQQISNISRPNSSCSDACSTNATISTMATRSTPDKTDNNVHGEEIGESDSETNSSDHSRDSETTHHLSRLSTDSTSNSDLTSRANRLSLPTLPKGLSVDFIKKQIEGLLTHLPEVPSIEEIEFKYLDDPLSCTCKITENVSTGSDISQNLDDTNNFLLPTTVNKDEEDIKNEQHIINTINAYSCQSDKNSNKDRIVSSKTPAQICKKSIFDLDFDDDEDPLHKIRAEASAMPAQQSKMEIINVKNIDISSKLNKQNILVLSTDYHKEQSKGMKDSRISQKPEVISVPLYSIEEDPQCKAKKRYEIQTQQITKFHITALHNCYIPNVNGNWDNTEAAASLQKVTNREENKDVELVKSLKSDHRQSVVPNYGSLVTECIPKDLSHIHLIPKLKLKRRKRTSDTSHNVPPFLGVARLQCEFEEMERNYEENVCHKELNVSRSHLQQSNEKIKGDGVLKDLKINVETESNNNDDHEIIKCDDNKSACDGVAIKEYNGHTDIQDSICSGNSDLFKVNFSGSLDSFAEISTQNLNENATCNKLYQNQNDQNINNNGANAEDKLGFKSSLYSKFKLVGSRQSSSCSNSSLKQNQNSINVKLRRRRRLQRKEIYRKLIPKHRSYGKRRRGQFIRNESVIKDLQIAINGNVAPQRQVSVESNYNSTDEDYEEDEEAFSKSSDNSQLEDEIIEEHGDEDDDEVDYHEVVTRNVSTTFSGNNHIVLMIKKTPSKTNSPSDSLRAILPAIPPTQVPVSKFVDSSDSEDGDRVAAFDKVNRVIQRNFEQGIIKKCSRCQNIIIDAGNKLNIEDNLSECKLILDGLSNVKEEPTTSTHNNGNVSPKNNGFLKSFNNFCMCPEYVKKNQRLRQRRTSCADNNELVKFPNSVNDVEADFTVNSEYEEKHQQIPIQNESCDVFKSFYNINENSKLDTSYNSFKWIGESYSGNNSGSNDKNIASTVKSDIKNNFDNTNSDAETTVASSSWEQKLVPPKECRTDLPSLDVVDDEDGNKCVRIQQFKEWHQVLQLRSYNDELLTVLPYVVLE